MEEIQAKVIQIISGQLGKDESEVKMSSHFIEDLDADSLDTVCLLYTSPSPRDKRQSRMPSSA